ncbi:hypothetical protein Ddc_18617 [Ditylenchus destructor]|nr:hypothetical protein Ddc_18617 [Ditylenchus destructor]
MAKLLPLLIALVFGVFSTAGFNFKIYKTELLEDSQQKPLTFYLSGSGRSGLENSQKHSDAWKYTMHHISYHKHLWNMKISALYGIANGQQIELDPFKDTIINDMTHVELLVGVDLQTVGVVKSDHGKDDKGKSDGEVTLGKYSADFQIWDVIKNGKDEWKGVKEIYLEDRFGKSIPIEETSMKIREMKNMWKKLHIKV